RGVRAHLRAVARGGAFRAVERAPRAGAAHPEGEALTALRPVSWVIAGAAAVELCAREVARRSPLHGIVGVAPPPWLIVAVAAAAVVVVIAQTRGRRSPVAPIFAALFVAGLALQIELGARLQRRVLLLRLSPLDGVRPRSRPHERLSSARPRRQDLSVRSDAHGLRPLRM